mgnify:CR=1 FL=1
MRDRSKENGPDMAYYITYPKNPITLQISIEEKFREVMAADPIVRPHLVEVLKQENPQIAEAIGEMWIRFKTGESSPGSCFASQPGQPVVSGGVIPLRR